MTVPSSHFVDPVVDIHSESRSSASGFSSIDLEEDVPNEGPDDDSHVPSAGAQVRLRIAKVVALIEKMQPTRPTILRAAAMHSIVAGAGRVFWAKERDFYHLSKVVQKYDQFLSHSWHVASWKKVMLLLILKNGLPAIIAGSLGALVMMVLWQVAPLPAIIKTPPHGIEIPSSCWCFIVASLAAGLTFILWRPTGSVFVDRVCINQQDQRLKTEGVLSIGAILSRSDTLLVVWDESWVERLWCVFELAAFLKAHPEKSSVHIKPVLLGSAAMSFNTAISFLCFALLLAPIENVFVVWLVLLGVLAGEGMFLSLTVRTYFRTLEATVLAVQRFHLETAHCWCCSVNHVDPVTSKAIEVCDREIVRQCVASWFGSEDEFDQAVRSLVAQTLKQELNYDVFPYTWILASTAPMLWTCMDIATTFQASTMERHMVGFIVIRTLAWWLWCLPIGMAAAMYIARRLSAKASSFCKEFFKTLLCLILIAPVCAVLVAWHVGTEIAFRGTDAAINTLGSAIFAGGCLVAFLLTRPAFHRSNARYFQSLGMS